LEESKAYNTHNSHYEVLFYARRQI
jgi:hypothetical protein